VLSPVPITVPRVAWRLEKRCDSLHPLAGWLHERQAGPEHCAPPEGLPVPQHWRPRHPEVADEVRDLPGSGAGAASPKGPGLGPVQRRSDHPMRLHTNKLRSQVADLKADGITRVARLPLPLPPGGASHRGPRHPQAPGIVGDLPGPGARPESPNRAGGHQGGVGES